MIRIVKTGLIAACNPASYVFEARDASCRAQFYVIHLVRS